MFKKKIRINGIENLYFVVTIHLNLIVITLFEKLENLSNVEVNVRQISVEDSKKFIFTDVIEEMLVEFSKKKEIETELISYFKENNVDYIEINGMDLNGKI